MVRIQIESDTVNTSVTFEPSQSFIDCAIPAVLAAVPVFLDSLMRCLAGGGGGGGGGGTEGYAPGTRPRCGG